MYMHIFRYKIYPNKTIYCDIIQKIVTVFFALVFECTYGYFSEVIN